MTIKYTKKMPCSELKHLIDHYWYLQYSGSDKARRIVSVPPDGQIEMVFHPGCSQFPQISTCLNSLSSDHNYAIGVTTRPTTLALPMEGSVVGVRFHVFGASPFTELPVRELTDRVFSFDEVSRRPGRRLSSLIQASLSDGVLPFTLLDDFFVNQLTASARDLIPISEDVAGTLAEDPSISVESLSRTLCMSTRQLERLFRSHAGISPKSHMRLRRLNNAKRMLAEAADAPLTHIALESGFYDQAHFCREFRKLAGLSPSQFRLAEMLHP